MKKQLEKILGFGLEPTANLDFGDYTSNIAMTMFSNSQFPISNFQSKFHIQNSKYEHLNDVKSPRELAEKIIEELKTSKDLMNIVDRIETAGPGFINFWLKTDVLVSNLTHIDADKEKYGQSRSGKDKVAIVEYSSANIAKPFTIGHLRSTIIGDAIANLLEFTGWKVLRDNHLGDWGTQFGKQIYAIKTWGKGDPNAEYSVKELVDLYVKFHEEAEKDKSLEDSARAWFKKLEDGDSEARAIWQKCADWSFKEFDRIYGILGIKFSSEFENGRGLGESFFENRMKPVIAEMRDKKILKEGKEGAELVFFDNDKYPPAMIIKKDGATLYHTRDLATDKYRKEKYNPDLIINEVGMEQKLYFEQLFEMERMLGWFAPGQRVHVGHGMVRFKEGKMSTRRGNVIWMDEVLNEAIEKAKRLGSKDTEMSTLVGIGALKYNDLKRDPKGDIVFDWDEVLNMEGNSGPYLQYTVARCNSVIVKALGNRHEALSAKLIPNAKSLVPKVDGQESAVLRLLTRFGEVVEASASTYSPNILCNYLHELASSYNSFYNKDRIIGIENKNDESFRIALTSATSQVLKNGLKLLGIQSPERM